MGKRGAAAIARWEAEHGMGSAWGNETDRAAVLVFDPAGGNRRVFASGLRNCVGLAVHPLTGDLWCSTNEVLRVRARQIRLARISSASIIVNLVCGLGCDAPCHTVKYPAECDLSQYISEICHSRPRPERWPSLSEKVLFEIHDAWLFRCHPSRERIPRARLLPRRLCWSRPADICFFNSGTRINRDLALQRTRTRRAPRRGPEHLAVRPVLTSRIRSSPRSRSSRPAIASFRSRKS